MMKNVDIFVICLYVGYTAFKGSSKLEYRRTVSGVGSLVSWTSKTWTTM